MKIKIINLNIWNGGKFIDRISKFIKQENPDICVFQEVYDGDNPKLPLSYQSVTHFKKELGFKNSVFSPMFIDQNKYGLIPFGQAMLTNFAILTTETIPVFNKLTTLSLFPLDYQTVLKIPRILQYSIIKLAEKKKLNVFNIQGPWGFDGDDNEVR